MDKELYIETYQSLPYDHHGSLRKEVKEVLRNKEPRFTVQVDRLLDLITRERNEAVREFSKRLKERARGSLGNTGIEYLVYDHEIDRILKELLNERNDSV